MNVLVIDNYDSFTYNLVHMVEALTGKQVTVARNDEISLDAIESFDKILLSPGPGIPDEAGNLKAIINRYAPTKSILGVCLGMQAIAEVFGGHLENLGKVVHGFADDVLVGEPHDRIFSGMPEKFRAGRYHSWVVSRNELPASLRVTATNSNGLVMALSHNSFDVKGVQFHPESVLTQHGQALMANWLATPPAGGILLPAKDSSAFDFSKPSFGLTC